MALNKLLTSFYDKTFIAIIPQKAQTIVGVVIVKNSRIKSQYTRTFDSADGHEELQLFVEEAAALSPLFYTALLSNTQDQGALPSCAQEHLNDFTDLLFTEQICCDDQWMIYHSRDALYTLQESYKHFGLDFIFSPFSLLKELYTAQTKNKYTLFMLAQADSITFVVFDNNSFEFGHYTKIPPSLTSETDTKDAFNTSAYFSAVENVLETYYHDIRYKGAFIEKIYLTLVQKEAPATFVKRLEDELFMDIEVQTVDIAYETAKLAAKEAGYAL